MGLKEYVIRRLITGTITLIITLIANWIIFRLPAFLTGIDPATLYGMSRLMAGGGGGPGGEQTAERIIDLIIAFKIKWDLPSLAAPIGVWIDHLIKYLINMITFNFGYSMGAPAANQPVVKVLLARLPYSLFLLVPATLIAIIVGISIGVKIGSKPGSKLDVSMMVIAMMLYALPIFWLQIIFQMIFGGWLRWWPASWGVHSTYYTVEDPLLNFIDIMYMLTLPILSLVIGGFGGWMILMRNSLVDVMTEDYIITARAKGLDEKTVLYKHAFRNAILPVVTAVILALAGVWTGAIITERVFNIPGVGNLFLLAVVNDNYPLAEMLFYFVALTVILANIIADISYAILDPRVKY